MPSIAKLFFTSSLLLILWVETQAQESAVSLGATAEFSVENPSGINLYGLQGKYDLSEKQGLQAQLGFGKSEIFFVGADYLYTVLPLKKMPSVFVGAGLAFENLIGTGISDFIVSSQAGLQFDIKRFSPYVAYKPKFYLQAEGFDMSVILFGVRYRL